MKKILSLLLILVLPFGLNFMASADNTERERYSLTKNDLRAQLKNECDAIYDSCVAHYGDLPQCKSYADGLRTQVAVTGFVVGAVLPFVLGCIGG